MTETSETDLVETALDRLLRGDPAALDPVAVAAEAGAAPGRFATAEALAVAVDRALTVPMLAELATARDMPVKAWTAAAACLLQHLLSPERIALLRYQLAASGAVALPRDQILAALVPLAEVQLARTPVEGVAPRVMVEWFLSLCLGDTQLRRLAGDLPPPPPQMISTRAAAVEAALDRMVHGPA